MDLNTAITFTNKELIIFIFGFFAGLTCNFTMQLVKFFIGILNERHRQKQKQKAKKIRQAKEQLLKELALQDKEKIKEGDDIRAITHKDKLDKLDKK